MSEVEGIIFDLDVRVSEMTMSELRKFETIAYRTISLLRRMGLPEEVDAAVMKLQRLVMTIRLAQTALIALQAAMLPGAGWLQAGMAAVTIGGAAFSASDFMMSLGE